MPDPSVLKLAEVPLLVVGRGFRIARDQLNGYFAAHGLKPILGNHFDNDQWHAIMTHFVNRGITCRFRIFLPSLGGFDPSPFVYILEDWVPVLTQRRIDIWGLGRPVPGAFMHLRHVLGASDDIGLYALYCWTQTWQVPELCDRYKVIEMPLKPLVSTPELCVI
jgi:hypothetical protein